MSDLASAIGGKERIIGGPFGSKLTTRDYTAEGVPVIRGSNMEVDGRWIGGEFTFVSDSKVAKDLRSNLASPGDIIVTQRGTLGQVSIVPEDSPFQTYVISQSQMAIAVDAALADRDFVYYYLRSPQFIAYSHAQTIQTGVPHINLGILRSAPAEFPKQEVQCAIATVLSALDNKIELNRKTAATLEAMARALYRSWFVDFDPVHAKAAGDVPAHMDAATAALFPASFGDDGLPGGWCLRPLDDIANFLNGVALQKYPAEEGEPSLPVIKISELRSGISAKTGRANTQVPSRYIVEDGDVLFSWSGSLMQKVWTEGRGALNQHLFKVTSETVPKWFHFLAVDQHMENFRTIAASKATTMGHIQRHHLSEAMVAVPNQDLMQGLDEIVMPVFDRMVSAQLESQNLAALRDTLLPKLMSGELRVVEAERQVAEAV